MTLEEAIEHCEECAKKCDECGMEHAQLGEWLNELQRYLAIGTVEKCREAVSRLRKKENGAKCEECLFSKIEKHAEMGQ
ncbi:MAG TPA: hypothetical protein IAA09_11240 [Candidatus Lachnoclostridium avicola]|nr:hypothetical protein [Candidatus Lachnoclostridium avicola]